jgi:hypothetical protein
VGRRASLARRRHAASDPAAESRAESGQPRDEALPATTLAGLAGRLWAEIVSACAVKSGRWLGSERVATDSNDIPAAQTLLRRAPRQATLRGLYDAMPARNARRVLAPVTVSKPAWLPR